MLSADQSETIMIGVQRVSAQLPHRKSFTGTTKRARTSSCNKVKRSEAPAWIHRAVFPEKRTWGRPPVLSKTQDPSFIFMKLTLPSGVSGPQTVKMETTSLLADI